MQDRPTTRLPLATGIGLGATALVALVALVSGGLWAAVSLVGLVLIGTAGYGLVLGRATWLQLPLERRSSGAAAGFGALTLVVGLLAAAVSAPSSAPVPAPTAIVAGAEAEEETAVEAPGSPPTEVPTPVRTAAGASTPTSTPPPTPTPTPTPTPVIVSTTVTESVPIARGSRSETDSAAEAGTVRVAEGADGVLTRTSTVITQDGVEVSRTVTGEVVTIAPVDRVETVGTLVPAPAPAPVPVQAGGCDSNYSGCVPIASDVDCAGGSGNGPAYVTGPVQVIGSDVYDLERDGDGIACD